MTDRQPTKSSDQSDTKDPPENQSGSGSGGDPKDQSGKESPSGFQAPKDQAEFDRMTQDRIDRAARIAREETEKETRLKIENEAKEAQAKESGKYEELYKIEQAKVADLEKRFKDLEDKVTTESLGAIRERIGEKYKIHADLRPRLIGSTETEIEEDAKKVAKAQGVPEEKNPGDPETGKKGTKKGSNIPKAPSHTFGSSTRRVPFNPAVKGKE